MRQIPKPKLRQPVYGQLVIGPPGSGKTTYCYHASAFLKTLGRDVCVINIDPANENMDYNPSVNIFQLITVEDVMEKDNLGPNGSLIYCIEFLEKNIDWLLKELQALNPCRYFIFDCPGQIELYTHHSSMSKIFSHLQEAGYHLVTVNLIDSHYCSEPTKFVSTLLMTLNTMLRMGLPQINVFSKADLLRSYESKLHFSVEFYTEVLDLKYLLAALDDTPALRKFHKLNAAICGMVEDYGLVSFHLLDARNNQSMLRLRNHIDKANGYIYNAGEEKSVNALMACAVGVESETSKQINDINPYL